MMQMVTLPNDKQLLFVGERAYQRFPVDEGFTSWESFDQRILAHMPVPGDAEVEVFK